MGINGSIKLQAFTDFLQALNSAGASFFIFRHTYDEFQGILEGAIYWIENPSYDPQKASRAATYFIENEFTASDIEQLILQVNERLKELKIKIVGAPGPQEAIEYQIAENELTAIIVEIYKKAAPAFDEVEKESTIYKDVKSVSAILKFRRGEMPTRLQDVKYVFMTTNSSLALASKIFETKISPGNYFFIPTVLTDIFVGTMAWAQSPAAVTEMNKRRLIANCYAALQPTKALVKTMTETADRLRSKGIITVEDVTLLRQSRVARNLLQEETLGDASRFTDKTAIDILEEIRAGVRQEERDKFNKEREGFQLKEQDFYGQIKKEKEKAREIELAHRQTKEELGKIKREKSQIEMNIEALARRLAKRIKVIFTVLAIGMILIALIFQFYPNSASSKWKLFLTITGIVFSILSLITGFNIKGAGDSLQKFVFKITVSLFKRKS
ncbi:MAG: hypothetical protein Q7U68_02940 [Candidatus Roizmanbacteria bacterium]|nr:hypothetical protein [Candidatus Roizmanbacteria bacterium]